MIKLITNYFIFFYNSGTRIDLEFDKKAFDQFFESLLPASVKTYEDQQMEDFFLLTDSGQEILTDNKEIKHRKVK